MSEKYIAQDIEQKWQQQWEKDGLYATRQDSSRPKWYALTMFVYPSGDLHTGHWYAFSPSDAAARWRRMKGYNVFFPVGFDAFGLPAENAAIKRGLHPREWTEHNIANMRHQLRRMGAMWAWDREIVTADPEYYKWTQWFFLKLYDAGLAYRHRAPVDWCPSCNTTLAREQVWGDDRHCERCKTPVIKRDLEQWMFRITKYADELLDFSGCDWPDKVKTMQKNWIGRSEGARVHFSTEAGGSIEVFTTRADTLWGATFMVLAPEHPMVDELTTPDKRTEVTAYREFASREEESVRTAADKDKTGVFTGSYAINPVNGERIPIWIADYVMMGYGTGAIMAVPAHDDRDFAFARKFGIEIRRVITGPDGATGPLEEPWSSTDAGALINSPPFDGTPVSEAAKKVTAWLEKGGKGRAAVSYRLRDWLISRQRMWGAPIPIIYCPTCGAVPVPYADLPVRLPDDAKFLPTGESPLKHHDGFLHVSCPKCGGKAERESDTMDTFMCSSWYQYAYVTPYHKCGWKPDAADTPWDREAGDYWLPVDQYTGGIEHATMHLLYTRFFTKALRDIGLVKFGEPMARLFNQGMILGPDGEKMSKSRGNVVNPDEVVQRYGADTVRGYLMFIGPWDQGGPWDPGAIEGVSRFLYRVWSLLTEPAAEADVAKEPDAQEVRTLSRRLHQTIQKVSQSMEHFRFNTAIAALMELTTVMAHAKKTSVVGSPVWDEAARGLLLLMAPIFPHISEELWHGLGHSESIHLQAWPEADADKAREDEVVVVIQVNGKIRHKMSVPLGTGKEALHANALALEELRPWLEGKQIRNVIAVPDKLVNIVVA